jgi:hypothetical protein
MDVELAEEGLGFGKQGVPHSARRRVHVNKAYEELI